MVVFYFSFNSSYFIPSAIAAFKKTYRIPVPYRLASLPVAHGV
ncbi:hypothetical protein D083_1982 [Dickeya solani RNS 08.23.3.1.A]|nr:hypothetical protein D083_1982 [Dickeya solani RNS 08.23.3.1.A]